MAGILAEKLPHSLPQTHSLKVGMGHIATRLHVGVRSELYSEVDYTNTHSVLHIHVV